MLSLGVDRRGTYVVSEQVEKAPTYDYACNLTRTAVRINFPEIKSEVFVNLLGYKGIARNKPLTLSKKCG